ncbi:MAG: DnaJ domain-containing protein [Pyrinomonadaceae bacterium]|nr:DnaJ domain-containing protein [Pyrinomonadaceae bacterium]
MNGKLTEQPLAELIREIGSKGLSGALRLEQALAKTVVYFEKGRIVFAASNLRTLRLGEYLKKTGVISEKEFAALATPAADLSMASSLRAGGKLSQKDFDSLLTTLVSDVLRVPLLWTDGTWEFDERARLDDPVRVTLDPTSLLKEAAQRLPLKFISLRFQNPKETISRSADGATNSFLSGESFILSRLDEPTKLEELVAVSGLRELDAYRVIYGLALSGFVQREYWQNAFRTEAAKTSPGTPPVTARGLPEVAANKPEATDRWTQGTEKDSEDSLGDFLERLRAATSFYEVIDVAPTAGTNEIKEAYYALARRYHPDRFHLKSGTRLHEQISSAFARITQAYETLIDVKARSTYDATLERSRKFAETAPKSEKARPTSVEADALEVDPTQSTSEQAERYFREGFSSLQQGQISAAITHLAAASRMNPQEARFRAYYGRALAANDKTRRLAESEIQTAVRLEPSSSLYRTMLAELYVDLKFYRRAQTELDKALELEPNNATALGVLRKLTKLRKVEA